MAREITEIVLTEHGDETHESWVKLVASKPSSTPGRRLFDSEIPHQRYVAVRVYRCTRTRRLNSDWLHTTQLLMELEMSNSQWGAFVSSFGDGDGVPATMTYFDGHVAQAPDESRLAESHREVLGAADKSLAEIREGYEELQAAFDAGAGKKELRARLHTLKWRIKNGPANMQFAAKSLTEHVENVVTKARADLEGMAVDHTLDAGTGAPLLESGDDDVEVQG